MSLTPFITLNSPINSNENLAAEAEEPMPLEDRLMKEYAQAALDSDHTKSTILAMAGSGKSDPASLLQLQVLASTYSNEMNLVGTLARKAVGCVDSLIKAQ